MTTRRPSAEVLPLGPRPFRPSIVTSVGSSFVVLDELQPVAAVVALDGSAADLVSWADAAPPAQLTWPWRAVHNDGTSLVVSDGPTGEPVRIDPSGGDIEIGATPPADGAPGLVTTRTRFMLSNRALTDSDGATWRARAVLEGPRSSAGVEVEPRGGDLRSWRLGRGAVCGMAVAGGSALVAVRRADKRPWRFRPSVDLALLDPDAGSPRWLEAPGADDVRQHCWPAAAYDDEVVDGAMRAALGDVRAARTQGAYDLGVEVVDLGGFPVVRRRLRHASRPGMLMIREDEPVTEWGAPNTGLLDLSIYLEEDLVSGFLPPVVEGVDGVLPV